MRSALISKTASAGLKLFDDRMDNKETRSD